MVNNLFHFEKKGLLTTIIHYYTFDKSKNMMILQHTYNSCEDKMMFTPFMLFILIRNKNTYEDLFMTLDKETEFF